MTTEAMDLEVSDIIARMTSAIEAAESRAAKAEAAGAEMRSVLLDSRKEHFGHRVSNGWFIARDRALMSDCGRGWLSPEKRRAALGLVNKIAADSKGHNGWQHIVVLMGKTAENAAAILKEDE